MNASPQKENGHTAIANELLDFLCSFRIPGECRQVFDCVMRKTWGWQKKEDYLANIQIMQITGMSKGNVSRALSKLITHGLVIKSDNKVKINKNYLEWIKFGSKNKKVIKSDNKVIKKATKVIKSDNKKLSKVRDTKEKKETIQKKESEVAELTSYLETFNGVYGTKYKSFISLRRNFEFWRKEYSLEEILRAVKRSKNVFWAKQPHPELLLRTRNKNGDCDYIGEILNTKSKDELELSQFVVKG